MDKAFFRYVLLPCPQELKPRCSNSSIEIEKVETDRYQSAPPRLDSDVDLELHVALQKGGSEPKGRYLKHLWEQKIVLNTDNRRIEKQILSAASMAGLSRVGYD
uniref:Uncharacterized protein n=1 Tax=Grammatophora oceanica TaxID=210454 RepID=A0A7S1V163_9STRA